MQAAPCARTQWNRWATNPASPPLGTSQHRQIKIGFLRAALSGPWRRRNFDRLMRLLAVHEAAEEAHVHPVARRALQHGRELAARRRAEEKQAKELLIALWRTGPDGAGYLRRLNEVRRAITQHAAHEEREEFQALRKAVGLPRLRMLGAEVKLTQAYAPTRPHRWVDNEAANKLAAPILRPAPRSPGTWRPCRSPRRASAWSATAGRGGWPAPSACARGARHGRVTSPPGQAAPGFARPRHGERPGASPRMAAV